MNEETQKRFRFLFDESEIAKVKELDTLINMSRDLVAENNKLQAKVKNLEDNRHSFYSSTIEHYRDFNGGAALFFIPLIIISMLFLTALAGLGVYAISHAEITDRFYIYEANDCMTVYREVTWGSDMKASECYRRTEEALDAMKAMKEANVYDGTNHTGSIRADSNGDSDGESVLNTGEDGPQPVR